ncbi:MAG TPA: hypothetical protein VJN02_11345 [Gammaproteobacteria bacterium]|nr:hypothetical protein [Gammaproteobacteria bacterium]
MQDTPLFTQLLGLYKPWKVTEVLPDLDNKLITVRIEWPKGEISVGEGWGEGSE